MSSPGARNAGKGVQNLDAPLLDPLPLRAYGAPAGDDTR
jgi:hypothetical protein